MWCNGFSIALLFLQSHIDWLICKHTFFFIGLQAYISRIPMHARLKIFHFLYIKQEKKYDQPHVHPTKHILIRLQPLVLSLNVSVIFKILFLIQEILSIIWFIPERHAFQRAVVPICVHRVPSFGTPLPNVKMCPHQNGPV